MIADIPGLPARRAALKLLDAVLRRGQPLEAALAWATQGVNASEDRALARAIASETLRRLTDLDALIDRVTRLKLADDAKVRTVLRMALAQALVLKTPPHAAIATALPLLEGGPRRLAHGVLGTLFRQEAALPELPNLPPEAAARWRAAWGDAMVADARAALASPAPIGLTFRDGHRESVDAGTDVTKIPDFADGAFWVQNVAASIPARLLEAGDGRHVLDLCAAPGGKTMQLAAAGWDVTAIDRDRARLVRLDDNLARTKLKARTLCADILKWKPDGPVDAILLDAPCTATGIFARHPDVLQRVRTKDIAVLADLQAKMIARAADWLSPGGMLIYATCSLEPDEGEKQLETAASSGLTPVPVAAGELPQGFAPDENGCIRVLPRPGVDGFFIARFRRA